MSDGLCEKIGNGTYKGRWGNGFESVVSPHSMSSCILPSDLRISGSSASLVEEKEELRDQGMGSCCSVEAD